MLEQASGEKGTGTAMEQSLLTELQQQLTPERVNAIGQQLGSDEETTAKAISAALPMLIGGLSYNANQSPEQVESLDRALERDHDGSLLDKLGDLLQGGGLGGLFGQSQPQSQPANRATDGQGILERLLGPRREALERGISQTSGLEQGKTSQLLALLAPIVMSALGRIKKQNNLSGQQVKEVLERDRSEIESRMPNTPQGGLLSILDSNKDGKVDMRDDIAKVGMALGAAFFMSRRGKR